MIEITQKLKSVLYSTKLLLEPRTVIPQKPKTVKNRPESEIVQAQDRIGYHRNLAQYSTV